jgi:hypothetical protein
MEDAQPKRKQIWRLGMLVVELKIPTLGPVPKVGNVGL